MALFFSILKQMLAVFFIFIEHFISLNVSFLISGIIWACTLLCNFFISVDFCNKSREFWNSWNYSRLFSVQMFKFEARLLFSIFCVSIDGIVLLWLCEKLLKYFQLSLSKGCFSKFYKYFNTEIIWFSNIFTSNFIEVLLDFQEKLDFLSNTAFFSKPFANVKQTWLRQREIFWGGKKKY